MHLHFHPINTTFNEAKTYFKILSEPFAITSGLARLVWMKY